jgi:hypothetical protein
MDKAGDILKEFLSFYNFEGGEKYVALFSSWRKMAGDDIAAHSRIVDLRKGALLVEVDHPGWMQMLQIKREEILKKLAAKYPDLGIRMIHAKLAKEGQFSRLSPPSREEGFPQGQPPAARTPLPGSGEKPETSREGTSFEAVREEELKNSLARLEKSLKEKKKKK